MLGAAPVAGPGFAFDGAPAKEDAALPLVTAQPGTAAAQAVNAELLARAESLVAIVKQRDAWNQAALSMAAKLHHLLAIEFVDDSTVTQLAKQFGWRMSVSDAHHGADLLEALDLRS